MVVDTSVITAIIIGEPERELFQDLVLRSPFALISVAAVVEISIVLRQKRRDPDADKLDELLTELRLEVTGIDRQQGELARAAYARYGKGRGPAALNFGDCLVYALAKSRDLPLLFKGDDFAQTDIVPAWRP